MSLGRPVHRVGGASAREEETGVWAGRDRAAGKVVHVSDEYRGRS